MISYKKTGLLIGLFVLSIIASAQDLKPVKDKDSKKFGYQDKKTKEWVIAPAYDKAGAFKDGVAEVAVGSLYGIINEDGSWLFKPEYDKVGSFDKNGFCEVMQKGDKGKLHGLLHRDGRVILTVNCTSINIVKNSGVILACRYKRLPEPNNYDPKSYALWGVYDFDGKTILDNWFLTKPNIINRELVIVKEADTGLMGLYDLQGNCRIMPQYLDLTMSNGMFMALGQDFLWRTYTDQGQLIDGRDEMPLPGYVKPYQTYEDDVRVAAYKHNMIGERIHCNQAKTITMPANLSHGMTVSCKALISPAGYFADWGRYKDNFIRLEPSKNVQGASIKLKDGTAYTLEANMYDAYGNYVSTVSNYGWLEYTCDAGVIYKAEGKISWLLMYDINANALAQSVFLGNYRALNPNDIYSEFAFSGTENWMLRNWLGCREAEARIPLLENVGIGSYAVVPSVPADAARIVENLRRRHSIFRRSFYIGQVLPATKVVNAQGEVTLKMEPRLVRHFVDKFGSNVTIEGDQEIWWGPTNNRYIRIDPLPIARERSKVSTPANITEFWDDEDEVNYVFSLSINLYEEDGTFVRNLGIANRIDFYNDKLFFIDQLGLVFKKAASWDKYQGYGGSVKFMPAPPIGNNISGLSNINW